MLNRLYLLGYVGLSSSVAGTYATIARDGIDNNASLISMAGTIVAVTVWVGTKLAPYAAKLYKDYREAKRTEDESDHASFSRQLAEEITRRIEAESKLADALDKIKAFEGKINHPPLQENE